MRHRLKWQKNQEELFRWRQHVWSYCEIKQTSAKFDQKTSDGWSLFPVLEIFILSVLLIHICFLIITVALFFVVPNNRQHCQSCELLYSRYEVRLIWFVTAVTCLIEIYFLAIFVPVITGWPACRGTSSKHGRLYNPSVMNHEITWSSINALSKYYLII